MDISDQHIQQVAASSHGASRTLLPLNYIHNLQTVDDCSPHTPVNYNTMHPQVLIMSSPSMGDHKAAVADLSSNAIRATAPMNSPCLVFKEGNTSNISPINLGLDYIPGLYKSTFDYTFNQIYDDQSHFFNIPGNSPHDNTLSTGQSVNSQTCTRNESTNTTSTGLNSATKSVGSAAFSSQASQLSACEEVLKSKADLNHFAGTVNSQLSRINDYPLASNGSFLHSLVDMESLKEEAFSMETTRGADYEHESHGPSTSTPANRHHHHHLLDFSNFPSFGTRDITGPKPSHNNALHHAINEKRPVSSDHNNVSCSHVVACTDSMTGTAGRGKAQAAPKRRKSQQKRVVCVPATGGVDRPTGECLPSDSWAWRKYGQKPIKNSPYPRSYYKCSSVKGCTARKQVERNPSDPMMIMITYTVEHSHSAASTAAAAAGCAAPDQQQQAKASNMKPHDDEEDDCKAQHNNGVDDDDEDKQNSGNLILSADGNDAMSEEESCDQLPISSEGNNASELITNDQDVQGDQAQISSYNINQQRLAAGILLNDSESDMDYNYNHNRQDQYYYDRLQDLGTDIHVDMGLLSTSSGSGSSSSRAFKKTTKAADDDFFAQLGELPDLFSNARNSVAVSWPAAATATHNNMNAAHDHISSDPASIPSTHINIDPFDLYYWP